MAAPGRAVQTAADQPKSEFRAGATGSASVVDELANHGDAQNIEAETVRALSLQQSIDLLFQLGQIIPDGRPDDLPINVEIIVNYLVAHASHLNPW